MQLITERPLTGDVDLDRATLIGALRAGSAWLSCPFVAPADSARLWAEQGDGALVSIGECRAQSAILRFRLARAADIRVFCDGPRGTRRTVRASTLTSIYRAQSASRRASGAGFGCCPTRSTSGGIRGRSSATHPDWFEMGSRSELGSAATSSRRERIPSLPNTLRRWYATVC
jgi:hypothetical protein